MDRTCRRWNASGLAALAAAIVMVPSPAVAQTDHLKCYQAQEIFVEWPRPLVLSDPLGGDSAVRIHNAAWFCNPVSKTVGDEQTTPITEPANHLTLYPLSNTSPNGRREITIENQFGTQDIAITGARLVAVPTRMDAQPAPDGISPFKCYVATGTALDAPATLVDEFHAESVRLLHPKFFCNPASMTFDGVTTLPETDEASLACYKIAPGSQPPVQHIDFDNQIGAPDTMRIGPSGFVCVPSTILTDPHGNDARRSPSVELQAKPQGRN